MILHGLKHSIKIIHTEFIYYNCPNCNKLYLLELIVFQNYISFLFLPLFPTYKVVDVRCGNCNVTTPLKNMPESIKLHFKNIKGTIKTSKWMFSGSILIIILFLFTYVFGTKYHESQVKKMLNIKKGNIYGFRVSNDIYLIYRFDKITKDTFYYKEIDTFFNSKSDLKEFPKYIELKYRDTLMNMSTKEYIKKIENNDIFEIN